MFAVWNITNKCPWDCAFCCVASTNTSSSTKIPDQKELSFEEKTEVLRQLIDFDCTINFSGGDPLYFEDDIRLIEKAVDLLPRERIEISTTGIALTDRKIAILKRAGLVTMTIDNLEPLNNPYRPANYSKSAMNGFEKLVKAGVSCAALTVLYSHTATFKNLSAIRDWLLKAGVKTWYILKMAPVGSGSRYNDLVIADQHLVELIPSIEALGNDQLQIGFQHTIEILRNKDKCHALHSTFGINAVGMVSACSWAYDQYGMPLHGFTLGKVPDDNISEIIHRSKNKNMFCNNGACRLPKK